MSFALIIRGPAGVGKTTIAREIKKQVPNLAILPIDSFRHVISMDSGPERREIAQNVGLYFTEQLIAGKYDLIIEEVFLDPYYKRITKVLRDSNYDILTVFLDAPLDILVDRDANRSKNKGRQVIEKFRTEATPFSEDFVIDTRKHSTGEIVSIIITKAKELGHL